MVRARGGGIGQGIARRVVICRGPRAKDSVAVALRLFRLPPLAVTSYATVVIPVTGLTSVAVAVVPATVKSAASTPVTGSLKVTRQIRVSALVGELEGLWRTIEVTVGGVVSDDLTSMLKVSLTVPPLPSFAVTFTATVPTSPACGVPEKAREAAVKPSHVGSAALSGLVAM